MMSVIQFEATLEADGTIRVPEEIRQRLQGSQQVSVQITPTDEALSDMTKADIWQSILTFMDAHVEQGKVAEPYVWNREELYDHLDKYYDEDSTG